ncbi:hypothetical protein SAY86_008987 [Trapa natans]|uniref:Uncharacterized protein n=1 Tax=Trapa natans TaxID=22666 RepID=A0AAN7QC16_TRANT|nr:hypothetical protein SAY86_008987 [Trapa natans]
MGVALADVAGVTRAEASADFTAAACRASVGDRIGGSPEAIAIFELGSSCPED